MKNNIKIETTTLKAFVYKDKNEGLFTVALEGKGGPIVSAPSHDEACDKFKEALKLSCAVQNLMTFYTSVKNAEDIVKEGAEPKPKRKERTIEFIEIQ